MRVASHWGILLEIRVFFHGGFILLLNPHNRQGPNQNGYRTASRFFGSFTLYCLASSCIVTFWVSGFGEENPIFSKRVFPACISFCISGWSSQSFFGDVDANRPKFAGESPSSSSSSISPSSDSLKLNCFLFSPLVVPGSLLLLPPSLLVFRDLARRPTLLVTTRPLSWRCLCSPLVTKAAQRAHF